MAKTTAKRNRASAARTAPKARPAAAPAARSLGAGVDERLAFIEKRLRELANWMKDQPPGPGNLDERAAAWAERVLRGYGEGRENAPEVTE